MYSSRTCGTNKASQRLIKQRFIFFDKYNTARVREQRQLYLKCTSLFSRQWTMKRKVPCWELRMMNRTWKKRLVWYRPRIQVQPRMTNWATILNKINLQKKKEKEFDGFLLSHYCLETSSLKKYSYFLYWLWKNEFVPGVFGLRNITFHVGQSGSETPQGCTEQSPVELREEKKCKKNIFLC